MALSTSSSSSSSSSMNYSTSSSSSSIDSSSSSYLDYSMDKTLPFIMETETINPALCTAFYKDYVYVGTGSDGILLKSRDRRFWSKICTVDDMNITALFVYNDKLYIGTSPNGKIYVMGLSDDSITLSQTVKGSVVGFASFNNRLYAATSLPSKVYVYDALSEIWSEVYSPYIKTLNKMFVWNSKLYLIMAGDNIICFNGSTWQLLAVNFDNVVSFRRVSTEPFSHVNNDFIANDNEDIYNITPYPYVRGLKSYTILNNKHLLVGSSYRGEILYYDPSKLKFYSVFQTQSSNAVYSLLNIDQFITLASIDNKVYMLFESTMPTTTTTTTTSTGDSGSDKTIAITYPGNSDVLVNGQQIVIKWDSNKSVNDGVKIDLYKGTTLLTTITNNTSNDGEYEWIVPLDLPDSNDYSILITWLTTRTTLPENQATSGIFSVLTAPPVTTTTTTTQISQTSDSLQYKNIRGIPILELQDEYVTEIVKDEIAGGVILTTSKGRILGCTNVLFNAYLTGERTVSAQVKDGFAMTSGIQWVNFFYALYNKIVEINENKEIVKHKFEQLASAIPNDRITGTFLSPILTANQDFITWKNLLWRESKPANTEITICLRIGNTSEELQTKTWDYCYSSNDSDTHYGDGTIVRSLDNLSNSGRYVQFRVTMTTDTEDISPVITHLSIAYSTKFAVYFFTTKFSLENNSGAKKGLVTGTMTLPQYTEVKFGICDSNSVDWNDYSVVEINKFFELNSFERVKVGVKMLSYNDDVPEVAEFALLWGGDIANKVN